MIQLSYLDYIAVERKSYLHRFSPKLKIIGMFLILFIIVTMRNLLGLSLLYVILITLYFTAKIPARIFSLTLYPLIFAVLFIFLSGFQILFVVLIFLKVLLALSCFWRPHLTLRFFLPWGESFRLLL